MQRALDALPSWLERWRLKVNVAKTQALHIRRSLAPRPLVLLLKLSMRHHVKNVVAQTRTTRTLLRLLLASHLPIRTRLTYAAPPWYALTSETSRNSLRPQQSLALRTITGASRYVRNAVIARDLHIENLDGHVRRLSTSPCSRGPTERGPSICGVLRHTIGDHRTQEDYHATSPSNDRFLVTG
ncbi:uncharacterized protein LOC135194202 [Vanessa tameamea]|uniref:Uncharacterized protein LOC135194202 n=1 Tax=Vanessa tameamea TaxID=334116 RepID=A0ABM4AVT9_VANTA